MLYMHHDAENTIRKVDKYFHMKLGSIDDPYTYIGVKLRKIRRPNGVDAWATSLRKYVHEVVKYMERRLDKEYDGRKLAKKASDLFLTNSKPELYVIPDLGPQEAQYYQSLIGVLQ